MVDEQIFIEVGKRWVEMMMDPGKKTKKAIKIHHQEWRKIREMILSVTLYQVRYVYCGGRHLCLCQGTLSANRLVLILLFKYLSPS